MTSYSEGQRLCNTTTSGSTRTCCYVVRKKRVVPYDYHYIMYDEQIENVKTIETHDIAKELDLNVLYLRGIPTNQLHGWFTPIDDSKTNNNPNAHFACCKCKKIIAQGRNFKCSNGHVFCASHRIPINTKTKTVNYHISQNLYNYLKEKHPGISYLYTRSLLFADHWNNSHGRKNEQKKVYIECLADDFQLCPSCNAVFPLSEIDKKIFGEATDHRLNEALHDNSPPQDGKGHENNQDTQQLPQIDEHLEQKTIDALISKGFSLDQIESVRRNLDDGSRYEVDLIHSLLESSQNEVHSNSDTCNHNANKSQSDNVSCQDGKSSESAKTAAVFYERHSNESKQESSCYTPHNDHRGRERMDIEESPSILHSKDVNVSGRAKITDLEQTTMTELLRRGFSVDQIERVRQGLDDDSRYDVYLIHLLIESSQNEVHSNSNIANEATNSTVPDRNALNANNKSQISHNLSLESANPIGVNENENVNEYKRENNSHILQSNHHRKDRMEVDDPYEADYTLQYPILGTDHGATETDMHDSSLPPSHEQVGRKNSSSNRQQDPSRPVQRNESSDSISGQYYSTLVLCTDIVVRVHNLQTGKCHNVSLPAGITGSQIASFLIRAVKYQAVREDEVTVFVEVNGGSPSTYSLPLQIRDRETDANNSFENKGEQSTNTYVKMCDLVNGAVLTLRSLTDNVGPLRRLELLSESFYHNLSLHHKLKCHMEHAYIAWRTIRGDGNCYYRAFYYSLVEQFITSPYRQFAFAQLHNQLDSVHYTDRECIIQHERLKTMIAKAAGESCWMSVGEFERDVIADNSIDQAFIRAFRMIITQFLIDNRSFKLYDESPNPSSSNSMTMEELIMSSYDCRSMEDYCNRYVMKMGEDAEGLLVDLGILSRLLGCNSVVVLLDRRADVDLSVLTPSPYLYNTNIRLRSTLSCDIPVFATVHLLLRPGHYELIYPRHDLNVQNLQHILSCHHDKCVFGSQKKNEHLGIEHYHSAKSVVEDKNDDNKNGIVPLEVDDSILNGMRASDFGDHLEPSYHSTASTAGMGDCNNFSYNEEDIKSDMKSNRHNITDMKMSQNKGAEDDRYAYYLRRQHTNSNDIKLHHKYDEDYDPSNSRKYGYI